VDVYERTRRAWRAQRRRRTGRPVRMIIDGLRGAVQGAATRDAISSVEKAHASHLVVVRRGGAFISYRGGDSGSYGVLLHRELTRHFGQDSAFLDNESLPAGADYVDELLSRVRRASVLIAVIGSRWLIAADAAGRRRIDDPTDWIRRELTEAFNAGITVIPVLTEDARMPVDSELPAEIAALGRCQYRRLRNQDASADLARILADLEDRGI
jgi:hypothetical protein